MFLCYLWLGEIECFFEVLYECDDVFGWCDVVILELFYVVGLCVSELIGFDWSDVDLDVGIVCVFGKGGKECMVFFGGFVW